MWKDDKGNTCYGIAPEPSSEAVSGAVEKPPRKPKPQEVKPDEKEQEK